MHRSDLWCITDRGIYSLFSSSHVERVPLATGKPVIVSLSTTARSQVVTIATLVFSASTPHPHGYSATMKTYLLPNRQMSTTYDNDVKYTVNKKCKIRIQ